LLDFVLIVGDALVGIDLDHREIRQYLYQPFAVDIALEDVGKRGLWVRAEEEGFALLSGGHMIGERGAAGGLTQAAFPGKNGDFDLGVSLEELR